MISFISSLEIINVACFAKPEGHVVGPNEFLWIAVSAAAAAVIVILIVLKRF